MIIEGRTITTIAEMQEFCAAAVAATHADPSTIRPAQAAGHARRRDRACGRQQGLRCADRHLVIYLRAGRRPDHSLEVASRGRIID